MEGEKQLFLQPDYDESRFYLLMQSPRVLYVYWELSRGLREALKGRNVRLRLNVEGRGQYCITDINISKKSHYFSDVEPGLSYNCEIGAYNMENEFFPLLRSNTVTAPHDRPQEGQKPVGNVSGYSSFFGSG